MSDQNTEFEKIIFPYPKLIQTLNYFFPQNGGESDVFTMQNLRRLARYSPYLGLVIILLIFASLIRDTITLAPQINPPEYIVAKFFYYMYVDILFCLGSFFQYFRYLFYALLAKIAKRSADIPLVLSFFIPLQMLGGMCLFHFIIFVIVRMSYL